MVSFRGDRQKASKTMLDSFPNYTVGERVADGVLQVIGRKAFCSPVASSAAGLLGLEDPDCRKCSLAAAVAAQAVETTHETRPDIRPWSVTSWPEFAQCAS